MAKDLREHLKEHYLGESLATERLSELHDLLQTDEALKGSFKSQEARLRFYARLCAAAAIIALAAIPFSYKLGKQDGQSTAKLPDSTPRGDDGGAIQDHAFVNLVAVKMHADWCNRCPVIAPVFDRVEREYGTKPVLLVTLDFTDEAQRRQSERLAEALGIKWILDRELPTGVIALVDRTAQEILAVASDPDDWPMLASAIGDNLPH